MRVTACRSWPLRFRLRTPSRRCGAWVPSACHQKEALGARSRTRNASRRLSLLFPVGGSGRHQRPSLAGSSGQGGVAPAAASRPPCGWCQSALATTVRSVWRSRRRARLLAGLAGRTGVWVPARCEAVTGWAPQQQLRD